jgi:hypothetical protein
MGELSSDESSLTGADVMKTRKSLVAALGALAVVALVSYIWFGRPSKSQAEPPLPPVLVHLASEQGVAGSQTVAVSPNHRAYSASGTLAGTPVYTFVVGDSAMPFLSKTRLLQGGDIVLRSAAGGDATAVDWVAIAGVVSPRVAALKAETVDGVSSISLAHGTFAAEVSPGLETTVLAYDTGGHVVAEREVPAYSPPSP